MLAHCVTTSPHANASRQVLVLAEPLRAEIFAETGRIVHDMYLYEVKKPAESSGAWDYYKADGSAFKTAKKVCLSSVTRWRGDAQSASKKLAIS
jgi:hypothetical protein